MSTVVRSGVGGKFTTPIKVIIKNHLESSWTETAPTASEIKFGVDWWDSYTKCQIHVRDILEQPRAGSTDWGWEDHINTIVRIHVFQERDEWEEHNTFWNMQQEINHIILRNPSALRTTEGIDAMRLRQFRDVTTFMSGGNAQERLEGQFLETVHHAVADLEFKYWLIRI